ncbi:uncharacterized protein LOC134841176 [Symsagittifera roscoffensis]|uniref:uncharacterized protein LOC134841176 n=1 Tax=Symsagittifera roscoffensis TaxID=84072 RepID=UPI00307BD547
MYRNLSCRVIDDSGSTHNKALNSDSTEGAGQINPCLYVKPTVFTVCSIILYFHLIAAIDWLELACNGYQLVEVDQRPVMRVLIAMSLVEGGFVAYTDGNSGVSESILRRNPARYYMDNESTCFDPVTGTMRVLVVKAGVIACLAVMAYGASIFTARQTLQEIKREVNMHMIGFKYIFNILQSHCVVGLLSNICCAAQIADYLSGRNHLVVGYVPIVGIVGMLLTPVVYRLSI